MTPAMRAATLVHEATHLGTATLDVNYYKGLGERPHDTLIFGWDINASTYNNWIERGFCVPGYSCK